MQTNDLYRRHCPAGEPAHRHIDKNTLLRGVRYLLEQLLNTHLIGHGKSALPTTGLQHKLTGLHSQVARYTLARLLPRTGKNRTPSHADNNE